MFINEKIVKEFLNYKKTRNNLSDRTIQIKSDILKRFFQKTKKQIEKITDKDIENFLQGKKLSNKNLNILTLRDFLKWYYKTEVLPDCIKDFELAKEKAIRNEQNNKDRIIKEEEYKKLLENTKDPQYKAIIETLYEFGLRISELTSMNGNDIQDTGKLIYITINESKTKKRTITTNKNMENLLRWFNDFYPYKNKSDKSLFIGKRTLKRLLSKNFTNSIYYYSKKVIGRYITPHDFRHTAITRDRENGMPDSLIELKYGLVKGSRMMKVYDKNGSLQLEKYYLNKLNPEEIREPIEKIKKERDKVKDLEKEIKELREELEFHKKNIVIGFEGEMEKKVNEYMKEFIKKRDSQEKRVKLSKEEEMKLKK